MFKIDYKLPSDFELPEINYLDGTPLIAENKIALLSGRQWFQVLGFCVATQKNVLDLGFCLVSIDKKYLDHETDN